MWNAIKVHASELALFFCNIEQMDTYECDFCVNFFNRLAPLHSLFPLASYPPLLQNSGSKCVESARPSLVWHGRPPEY